MSLLERSLHWWSIGFNGLFLLVSVMNWWPFFIGLTIVNCAVSSKALWTDRKRGVQA